MYRKIIQTGRHLSAYPYHHPDRKQGALNIVIYGARVISEPAHLKEHLYTAQKRNDCSRANIKGGSAKERNLVNIWASSIFYTSRDTQTPVKELCSLRNNREDVQFLCEDAVYNKPSPHQRSLQHPMFTWKSLRQIDMKNSNQPDHGT